MVEVSVGGLDVLSSGSVIIFNDEPLIFTFDDNDGKLTVRCFFETDDHRPNGYLEEDQDNIDEEEFTLRFLNFNKTQTFKGKGPIEVGTYDDRKLLLRYLISVFEKHKQMHYTWYLE